MPIKEGGAGVPGGVDSKEQNENNPQGFQVHYSLSSLMPVEAEGEYQASEKAFANLRKLIDKVLGEGITSEEAKQVRLGVAKVSTGMVEKLPVQSDEGVLTKEPTPRQEFFEITSLSRVDLEEVGFDTKEVTDETMERLARKMADDYVEEHFWLALEILAEMIGISKREEDDSSSSKE